MIQSLSGEGAGRLSGAPLQCMHWVPLQCMHWVSGRTQCAELINSGTGFETYQI